MLGMGGILAGCFILFAISWDRWFPEVVDETIPPEARMHLPSSTGSTLGDAGSFFGPWLLLGVLFAVAGLWLVVRESRKSSVGRRRPRGGAGNP